MSRSVALSPQFGNVVTFGGDYGRRRRRAKSVHVPVPEGLRVVAVCVPDEVDEAPRTRASRPAPHRSPVGARRVSAAATRSTSGPRAGTRGVGVAGSDAVHAASMVRRAGPATSAAGEDPVGGARSIQGARPVAGRAASATVRQPQPAKLRLTRRGQIVLTLLVTGLLLAMFSLGRFSAGAAGDPVPHRTVVVHSGDTLWSIAASAAPSADPRVTVEKIRVLNHLDGGAVQVGQQLQLP